MPKCVESLVKAEGYLAERGRSPEDAALRKPIERLLPGIADLPAEEIRWPGLELRDLVVVTAPESTDTHEEVITDIASAVNVQDLATIKKL
jgi:hypothetical protein